MAGRGPARGLARDGHRRGAPRRVEGRLAHADPLGLLRARGRGRPRVHHRLAGGSGLAHAGRDRADACPRRGERRGAVDPRVADVVPHALGQLRGRPPVHAHRRRRPRLRRRRHRTLVLFRRRDRRGALGEGLRGRVRHERPGVGHRQRPAGRRRPPLDGRRRRARRPRGRLRQAHRRRAVAGDRGRGRDGLRAAGHLRGGRGAAAHRLASARPRVARPRDRRALLGAAVGRLDGGHGGDAGPERQLPARLAVLQRLADDAVEPGPARRRRAVAGGGAGASCRGRPTPSTRW